MRLQRAAMTLACTLAGLPLAAAEQETPPPCPLHAEHMAAQSATEPAATAPAERPADLDARGDRTMGFSHETTVHHFRLAPDGGAIEVEATDPEDAASRERIREHLTEVAASFGRGDFAMPLAIHGRVLPGVETMTRRADAVSYRFEEMPKGGRVRVTSGDPEALAAIHAFLQAQIRDHRTGDPASALPPGRE